jgi:hypothetical protein
MEVEVTMAAMAVPMGFDLLFNGNLNQSPMADTALGDNVPRQMFHIGGIATEDGNFHDAVMVEMDMGCRQRQVMMVVEGLGKPPREVAGVVVIYIDQRSDAGA